MIEQIESTEPTTDVSSSGPLSGAVSALSRRNLMALAGTALPVALAGCSQVTGAPGSDQGTTASRTPLPGTLTLGAEEGFVGDTLTIAGGELPAGEELTVVWHTVQGRWALIRHMNIVGPKYAPRIASVGTVTTDASGRFETRYTIPEDYGGDHHVVVERSDGTPLARATFTLLPSVEIDRTTAPLGETFTVETHGMEPIGMHECHAIAWDAGYGGIITTVSNRGHGVAEVRAAGPPGKHHIKFHNAYLGLPFLMMPQSPFGAVVDGRNHSWVVEVTEPERAFEPWWSGPRRSSKPAPAFYPALDESTDAELSIAPTSGVVGDEATIRGSNFPANESVNLVWYTINGSRVTSGPIENVAKPDDLPTVRTDANGAFERSVTIPADKGGTRPIVARVGGRSVAVTGFVIQPKIVGMTETEGPIGTPFEIQISGLGWTEYGNTYALLWDNHYLGYGCGMDDDGGIVRYQLEAGGQPGLHFIDMYPGLYRADEGPSDFHADMYGGKAQLTYRSDHPGNNTPSLHFAFRVTD